ncbi:hypothetical protein DL93DRAFT_2098693 [Clavulina sp. PMI_390]|nr:hypothetical protein DL93DRAFT_2098693 [Clavulina sp. PMI_390]
MKLMWNVNVVGMGRWRILLWGVIILSSSGILAFLYTSGRIFSIEGRRHTGLARLSELQTAFEGSGGKEHVLKDWDMWLGSLGLAEYTAELEQAWHLLFGMGRRPSSKFRFPSWPSSDSRSRRRGHPIPWRHIAEHLRLDTPPSSEKIPHRVWTTSAKPPQQYPDQFRYWAENDPSLTFRHLDDSLVDEYLSIIYPKHSPMTELLSLLQYAKNPKRARVLKADIFRYTILLHRGGIYTDTDTALVKPFDQWTEGAEDLTDSRIISNHHRSHNHTLPSEAHTAGLVVAVEKSGDPSWRALTLSRGFQVVQWTIAARRGHPVFLDILWRIVVRWIRETEGAGTTEMVDATDVASVLNWTGPGPWSDAVARYLLVRYGQDPRPLATALSAEYHNPIGVGDVVILPQRSFQAPASEKWSAANSVRSCVWHGFEGSWKASKASS